MDMSESRESSTDEARGGDPKDVTSVSHSRSGDTGDLEGDKKT